MYLNCHSTFSLRFGTLTVEQLVDWAARYGCPALALTDLNNCSAAFDFVKACRQQGIRPVVGIEFRRGNELLYIGLAENVAGFAELNAFLTRYLLDQKPLPVRTPDFAHVFTIYPLGVLDAAYRLREREYVGVRPGELTRFWRYARGLDPRRAVALQPVTFVNRPGFNLHRLLRAIDQNCLLSKLDPSTQAGADEWFRSPEELAETYRDYPELLLNAQTLLDRCSFEFDFAVPKNRKVFTTSAADDLELLRKLAEDGLRVRYPATDREAKRRVERELKVIGQLGFGSYFLITHDLVRYARSRGFFHVGRGSGANSIVAYCLGITDVDPIELDLYFERFINPHRTSPPDFDIDFSWDERDEIIDYVFKRYGSEYVCLMATYATFRGRSILRELGKVFGLPKAELDAWVEDAQYVPTHPHAGLILRYGARMEDFPNHLGIHAGGILVSEAPLTQYSALQPMPKGFPICQFDMYVAEDIGFAKFDVLSQRGLGHIKEAVDLVRENRGIRLDIHAVQDFKRDERLARQLAAHETMGCFYIESPAMRQLLWKLGCRDYLTLVAASSIIRPGVSSSGMMKAYIERHHNPSNYVPVHPKMDELLQETYGVMVYQEDVIKVAHYFAGLTLGEADLLRRGMSGKYRSRAEFQKIQERFFENCRERGYEDGVAAEVWRQIESFAGYSFSKAHSASFAVESYQSLFLKTYYPLEFLTAVVNNFGGFYATEFYLHEARRQGATLEAPDVNESRYLTRIRGTTLWLGWVHVKALEKRTVEVLLAEGEREPYRHFDDFVRRVPLGLEQLLILVRIGAFRSFGIPKKELLWQAHLKFNARTQPVGTGDLFEVEEVPCHLPILSHHPLEDAYDELELLGFPLTSPYALFNDPTPPERRVTASVLAAHIGQGVALYGYLVTTKPVRTKTGGRMAFGYFVDEQGEYFDTVHFPPALERYPFRGRGVYRLRGIVTQEFGVPALDVRELALLPRRPDPRAAGG